MDGGNETIFIATDVEYHIAINVICTGEMLSQLTERIIVGPLDDPIPGIK
jgi:hypothetical protein